MSEDQLTIPALQEKIERTKADLAQLQTEGGVDRRFEVLSEYLSYMEDELRMMKEEARRNGRENAQAS